MTKAFPDKLTKEPLIDAVFELRFSSASPAANFLPGFLFAKLEPKEWNIEQLGAAQIPPHIRASDPNLKFQPLQKIR